MAERDHAGVADQDVRRHREQAPDQDLGGEALPELRQHERLSASAPTTMAKPVQ